MIEERKVLFVDDEVDVLSALRRQFRKADFQCSTALGGDAALQLLEKEHFQIIITDERMPGMTGIELLQKVKILYPDTVRIVLTGFAENLAIIAAINKGEVYRLILKPWSKEQLSEIIEESFNRYITIQKNQDNMRLIIEENKKLHKALSSRENDLEITHEILELLPTPALVINYKNKISYFNTEAAKLLGIKFEADIDLSLIFPERVSEQILESFNLPGGQNRVLWEAECWKAEINIRMLRPSDNFKSLIFIEIENS